MVSFEEVCGLWSHNGHPWHAACSQDSADVDRNIFGEERYTGGRDNSSSNWPGLGGRPPLVINAPR